MPTTNVQTASTASEKKDDGLSANRKIEQNMSWQTATQIGPFYLPIDWLKEETINAEQDGTATDN